MNVEKSEFRDKKITPLFWKYSLFALAGLLLQALSVVADGFIVGNGIGADGLATIGVIVPLWVITVAVLGLFGIGASTIAAMRLGTGDKEGARKVYGSVIIFAFYFSVAVATIAIINVDAVLTAFGATDAILETAKDYAIPFLFGAPICVVGSIAYYFGRVDERPLASAIAYMGPAAIAIVLEYILIFKMGFGMEGSSITWVVCVGMSILLIPYFQWSKSTFKLRWSDLYKVDLRIVWETMKIGFAYFAIQICTTISTIVINNQISTYGGGELEIAAFGIVNAYIAYILMMISTAFIMGIQPIVSFNLGAKLYGRVSGVLKTGAINSTILLSVALIIVIVAAKPLVGFFTGPIPELIDATTSVMMVFLLLFPLGNLSQYAAGYYMAAERNGFAILNGISRIVIFAVPLLFLLPTFFGIKGIWMAQPVADLCAFILALTLIVFESKKLKKMA